MEEDRSVWKEVLYVLETVSVLEMSGNDHSDSGGEQEMNNSASSPQSYEEKP